MDIATEIRLEPAFRRYTPAAAESLARIAAALTRIETADIRPAAEDQLRVSARVGTVHYSTLIEGNELPEIEAERAARRELAADTKAKIELVNYVEALDLLDEWIDQEEPGITPELILNIHGAATKGLGTTGSERFAPHHEGAWRDGEAVVADQITGTVFHRAPPPGEVAARINGFCRWVAEAGQRPGEYPAPVVAGVVHYAITDIHPFADGNGRVARLLAAASMMKDGLLPGRLFSFERYYAENREEYYAALRSVRRETLNMTGWLEFFLRGLVGEYERVAEKVAELEGLGLRSGAPTQLSLTQERAITDIKLRAISEFRRLDYQQLAGVNKTQAIRDLAALRKAGLIVAQGSGPATRYRFRADGWGERRGRTRTWTDERIENELKSLVEEVGGWPTVALFRGKGKMSLYQAIQRYGGSAAWANRVGVSL
jgi:Fic family protein